MKSIFLSILAIVFFNSAKAAVTDSVIVDSKNKKVTIGTLVLGKDSAKELVIKHLGKPSRIETSGSGTERTYAYDELGLSFAISTDGKKIEAVVVNYNWDGDKKAAKSTYKGILKLDGYVITQTTTSDNINGNTQIKNVTCLGAMMCMTPPGKSNVALLIGYNAGKITQIGFGLVM